MPEACERQRFNVYAPYLIGILLMVYYAEKRGILQGYYGLCTGREFFARVSERKISLIFWPHRLTVRTQGSHPCNPGSIPGEVTMKLFNSQQR